MEKQEDVTKALFEEIALLSLSHVRKYNPDQNNSCIRAALERLKVKYPLLTEKDELVYKEYLRI